MSFNVKFIINGNLEVNESASDNLMFAELIYKFSQKVGLKEEHKAAFIFNSDKIKAESTRKLKDIGIEKNSVINVITEKPLYYKPENIESSKIPQNNYIGMGMNMNNSGNIYMNPNVNNFGNMNINPNMNVGNMNMNPNMKYGFNILFSLNGGYTVNMYVNENMLFIEVAEKFYEFFQIKRNDEVIFIYNSRNIKPDSCRTLKEIGMKNMSKIEVITQKPINIPFNPNNGNMGMNPLPNMGLQNYGNMNFGNMNETIQIVFNYKNLIQVNKDTPFSEISKRFCTQAGILNKDPIYYLGSRKIDSTDNQTLRQLNIQNNSEISVLLPSEDKEEYLNIRFNSGGKTTNVQATKNTQFSDLCKRYCNIAGIQNKDPIYLFNSCAIKSNEIRTLAQLNISNESKIDVLLFLDAAMGNNII